MGTLHFCFCVILILSVCGSGTGSCSHMHEPVRRTCTESIGKWNECKYSKCRILYYCNSTASFQLCLLVYGDIDPNPGPGENSTKYLSISRSQQRQCIKYDRSFLLLSNPAWSHLPLATIDHNLDRLIYRTSRNRGVVNETTWRRVKELGIQARQRGTRGGQRKQRDIKIVSSQQRHHGTHHGQRGVNKNNLQYIRTVDPSSRLSLHLMNTRSIRNKTVGIYDYAIDEDVDILVITETWLSEDDPAVIQELKPSGYSFMNIARGKDPHGGIGILYKTHLNLRLMNLDSPPVTFELAHVVDERNGLHIFAIYRPPPSSANGFTTKAFLDEIDEFFGRCAMLGGHIVIVGDFNVHVDQPSLPVSRQFLDLISASGFRQHIELPTHQHGHTLDLVISRCADNILHNCGVLDKGISDHYVINCDLNLEKLHVRRTQIRSRNYRLINQENFSNELDAVVQNMSRFDEVNEQVEFFNKAICDVLDRHCPVSVRMRRDRPCGPWYDDNIHLLKRIKRKSERKWRKTNQSADRDIFLCQKEELNAAIVKSKSSYFTNVLLEANCKTMYSTIHSLLGTPKKILPYSDDHIGLANRFAGFFDEKISKIRTVLDEKEQCLQTSGMIQASEKHQCEADFSSFVYVSPSDVKMIVTKSVNKSCFLDPMPTWLVKENIDVLVPSLVLVINSSLRSGVFPDKFKEAIVTPCLKKSTLDSLELASYRPVSNLAFLSKVLETVVSKQLVAYLDRCNLHEVLQSAYKAKHSTESALLRVKHDLLLAMDNKQGVIMVMLDLKSAFDTIDHLVLLRRLQSDFSFSGTVLDWFQSYLEDRSFKVSVGNHFSHRLSLKYGVPQGSVLGPLLFTLYLRPLGDILRNNGADFHLYADDVQLYYSFNPKSSRSFQDAILMTEKCVSEVNEWMIRNKLLMNEQKTESLLIISPRLRHYLPDHVNLLVGDAIVEPSESVRTLGVELDSSLTMSQQITSLCKSLNFHLYNISRVRRMLTKEACHHAIRSLVLSRLDNANSLLININVTDINRLQRIQNRAARIVSNASKYDHVSPLLLQLHWLPVSKRIMYKVALFVYQSLHNLAPHYISSLFRPIQQSRYSLRSRSDPLLLQIPHINSKKGQQDISFSGPTIWNSLPSNIRSCLSVESFKRNLKTHLFSL